MIPVHIPLFGSQRERKVLNLIREVQRGVVHTRNESVGGKESSTTASKENDAE